MLFRSKYKFRCDINNIIIDIKSKKIFFEEKCYNFDDEKIKKLLIIENPIIENICDYIEILELYNNFARFSNLKIFLNKKYIEKFSSDLTMTIKNKIYNNLNKYYDIIKILKIFEYKKSLNKFIYNFLINYGKIMAIFFRININIFKIFHIHKLNQFMFYLIFMINFYKNHHIFKKIEIQKENNIEQNIINNNKIGRAHV